MTMIDISNFSFAYPSAPSDTVLHDITCRIEPGSFVGLVGESGAGKTTFCRMIPGFIPHHFDGEFTGSITVNGIDVVTAGIGELSASVGFVFESPFDQLTGASSTVTEEVAFALENLGVPADDIRARVAEALETVGITDLADRHPGRLSGGQCQRLAIASILAMQPQVLVLDEPTSQLDPLGSEDVMEVVSRMHQQGYTIVLATQELGTAAPHLDRLIHMADGGIVADGPPREIIARMDADDAVTRPETVEVSLALRAAGLVDDAGPLPLTVQEVVDELGEVARSSDLAVPATVDGPTDAVEVPFAAASSAPTGGVAVETRAVTHRYGGEVLALDGIDLRLDRGCVCLLGQNGAGKTTLVKHLNGLLRPTEGTVQVDGEDIEEWRVADVAAKVALAFQNPDDQLFKPTVADEVSFGGANLGHDDETVARLTDDALALLELDDDRDAKPYELGLAGRKRVAVASVVAMDTPVVVLDEPTGAQDGRGNRLFGRLIDGLVAAGKLVVVVTHDVEFANAQATRIVVMHQGDVLVDGNARTVFADADLLARTHVQPPVVTRVASALGLPDVVLDIEELLTAVDAHPTALSGMAVEASESNAGVAGD